MFDDRHLAAIRHGADQTLAAARHAQEVHVLRERKQNRNRLAVGARARLEWRARENPGAPSLPASIIVRAMIWLEFNASLPPRRIVALPDLKHRLAASAVTLGAIRK
jgi:hypothetical protein